MVSLVAMWFFFVGGVGGIVFIYWVLWKVGMLLKNIVVCMVVFNVFFYAVYMFILLINGVLLWIGVFFGLVLVGMMVVLVVIVGVVIVIFLFIIFVFGDFEKCFSKGF